MSITHLLKDFSPPLSADSQMTLMSEIALEDHRLASFEQGYTAGWDDAFHAQENDQSRILGALGRNLEDLSFSYQEAHTQMIRMVTPILEALVKQVLPEVMQDTIGSLIVERVTQMIHEEAGRPISLVVPPGVGATIQPLLSQAVTMPVAVIEDTELAPGQAQLRFDSAERDINLTRVLEEARQAIESFAYEIERELEIG